MRNGLVVKGFFSYSDGHQLRKVNYVADSDGYRILSDDIEPLSASEKNHTDIASVSTNIDGSENRYKVYRIKSRKPNRKPLNNHQRDHSNNQQDHSSFEHEEVEEWWRF